MSVLGLDSGSGVPSGTPSGKGLYLTECTSSRPNTDTICRAWISNIGRVKSQYTGLGCRKNENCTMYTLGCTALHSISLWFSPLYHTTLYTLCECDGRCIFTPPPKATVRVQGGSPPGETLL